MMVMSPKGATRISASKHWLALNDDNVSERSDTTIANVNLIVFGLTHLGLGHYS
jgi:hypothetical protein